MLLTIEHTAAAGTLLEGTSRGDGAAEVVKPLGWRWGRSIGEWYIPRSRDRAPQRALIEKTAQQLREAGFGVEVSVDVTIGDRAAVEARRAGRAEDRALRLEERAAREQAAADARFAAADDLGGRIPFGQPILAGHHSQRRAERIRSSMSAGVEHQERAGRARSAARTAAAATGARHNPVTVANRVERLGADIRRGERELDQFDRADVDEASPARRGLVERLEVAQADLEHWRGVRTQQLRDGVATGYGRHNVEPGDLVKILGTWRRVTRCNPKSVTVETDYSWTDRVPWHKVQDHRSAPGEAGRS